MTEKEYKERIGNLTRKLKEVKREELHIQSEIESTHQEYVDSFGYKVGDKVYFSTEDGVYKYKNGEYLIQKIRFVEDSVVFSLVKPKKDGSLPQRASERNRIGAYINEIKAI